VIAQFVIKVANANRIEQISVTTVRRNERRERFSARHAIFGSVRRQRIQPRAQQYERLNGMLPVRNKFSGQFARAIKTREVSVESSLKCLVNWPIHQPNDTWNPRVARINNRRLCVTPECTVAPLDSDDSGFRAEFGG
jgi:hypothetical protein